MKKALKWCTVILLAVFCALLYMASLPHYDHPTHFDVVIVDGHVYFVLEKEARVKGLQVVAKTNATAEIAPVEMWRFGDYYSGSAGYTLKRRQIKYGEKLEGFSFKTGSKELRKLIRYEATINSSAGVFAGHQEFVIMNNNEVVMLSPACTECIKKRVVIVETNGKETITPYAVSLYKDGNKRIISESGREK